MPLATTVIGSWPKPSYLALPDWFSEKGNFAAKTQVLHIKQLHTGLPVCIKIMLVYLIKVPVFMIF